MTSATDSPMSSQTLGSIAAEVMSITFETLFRVQTPAPQEGGASKSYKALALTLSGTPTYELVVAWDSIDEIEMRKLFSVASPSAKAVAPEQRMLEDALGETINIVAGQVKSQLALDHALGLPRRLSSKEIQDWQQHENGDGTWLRANSQPAQVLLTLRSIQPFQ